MNPSCASLWPFSWYLFNASLLAVIFLFGWCYADRDKRGAPFSTTVTFFTFVFFVLLWATYGLTIFMCYFWSLFDGVAQWLLR